MPQKKQNNAINEFVDPTKTKDDVDSMHRGFYSRPGEKDSEPWYRAPGQAMGTAGDPTRPADAKAFLGMTLPEPEWPAGEAPAGDADTPTSGVEGDLDDGQESSDLKGKQTENVLRQFIKESLVTHSMTKLDAEEMEKAWLKSAQKKQSAGGILKAGSKYKFMHTVTPAVQGAVPDEFVKGDKITVDSAELDPDGKSVRVFHKTGSRKRYFLLPLAMVKASMVPADIEPSSPI